MKIAYSCYKFAPEMLQVTVNGISLPGYLKTRLPTFELFTANDAGVITRIIRETLFSPVKKGRYFIIKKVYDDPENQWLNESRSGYADYKTAKAVLKEMKQGALGSAKFTMSARLIG